MSMTVMEVALAGEDLKIARARWMKARREFDATFQAILTVVVLRGLENRMSVNQLVQMTGVPRKTLIMTMASHGIKVNQSQVALAAGAAEALHKNATLLGIDPKEMDLSSPLAYLPMGSELRGILETSRTPTLDELCDVFAEAWEIADEETGPGTRVEAGLRAVFALTGTKVEED